MKINLRSIIITVVIILLASNICIGIFYVNKYEKFKKMQQDTIIYQINIKSCFVLTTIKQKHDIEIDICAK